MESAAIRANWERFFPGIPPVGSELRTALPDRWIRFHSLPGSKSYPENEAEYAELLSRHNTTLGELALPNEKLTLITTGFSYEPIPTRSYPELFELDPYARPWLTIKVDECDDEDDSSYWHFYASDWAYRPGIFDSHVRLVADEVISNVLIVASDYRWLLHPYDGGMDLIAESSEARNSSRKRHRDWLSERPDGL